MFIAEIEIVAIAEVPILRLSLHFPPMLQLVTYSFVAKRSSHTISSQQQELSDVQIFSSTFYHIPRQSTHRAQLMYSTLFHFVMSTILVFNIPFFVLSSWPIFAETESYKDAIAASLHFTAQAKVIALQKAD